MALPVDPVGLVSLCLDLHDRVSGLLDRIKANRVQAEVLRERLAEVESRLQTWSRVLKDSVSWQPDQEKLAGLTELQCVLKRAEEELEPIGVRAGGMQLWAAAAVVWP